MNHSILFQPVSLKHFCLLRCTSGFPPEVYTFYAFCPRVLLVPPTPWFDLPHNILSNILSIRCYFLPFKFKCFFPENSPKLPKTSVPNPHKTTSANLHLRLRFHVEYGRAENFELNCKKGIPNLTYYGFRKVYFDSLEQTSKNYSLPHSSTCLFVVCIAILK